MGTVTVTTNLGDAPAAMMVAGTYKGNLNVSVMGNSYINSDDHKLTIEAQEDGKVEVTLEKFGGEGMGFKEDIVIKDVELTVEDDGTYTLTATIDTAIGTTAVTGSLDGTIKDKKANLEFQLKPGAMPFPLIAKFASK